MSENQISVVKTRKHVGEGQPCIPTKFHKHPIKIARVVKQNAELPEIYSQVNNELSKNDILLD